MATDMELAELADDRGPIRHPYPQHSAKIVTMAMATQQSELACG